MNKQTLALGVSIALTTMLMIPINIPPNVAKAYSCSSSLLRKYTLIANQLAFYTLLLFNGRYSLFLSQLVSECGFQHLTLESSSCGRSFILIY